MVKAALLYADHVSVISPTTVLLREARELGRRTLNQQIRTLRHIMPRITLEPRETARRLRGLALAEAALQRYSGDPSVRSTVRSQVEATTRTIADIADRFLAEGKLAELAAAEAKGDITYDPLSRQDDPRLLASGFCAAVLAHEGETPSESDRRSLVDVYLRKVGKCWSSATRLLLLDAEGRRLLGGGLTRDHSIRSLADAPIARLPFFVDASVEDVLNIRSEAAASLSDACRVTLRGPTGSSRGRPTTGSTEPWPTRVRAALRELADATIDARARRSGDTCLVEGSTDTGPSLAVMRLRPPGGDSDERWPICLVAEPC